MNKLKITLWIGVLANAVIAYAGMHLSLVFMHIFEDIVEGGADSMPPLCRFYIRHEQWCLVIFTIPLLIAALILTLRRSLTIEGTLLFGAVIILNLSLQVFVAVVALGKPYIPVIVQFQG
jgi:hypothetical protein